MCHKFVKSSEQVSHFIKRRSLKHILFWYSLVFFIEYERALSYIKLCSFFGYFLNHVYLRKINACLKCDLNTISPWAHQFTYNRIKRLHTTSTMIAFLTFSFCFKDDNMAFVEEKNDWKQLKNWSVYILLHTSFDYLTDIFQERLISHV